MKWKCSECGNEFSSPLDERYSFLSEKYSDDPASHCKVCKEESELKKRATVIINQVDVTMDIAYAYAKAERTHFVATGQEVDIIQLMNIPPTCGSMYDRENYRGVSALEAENAMKKFAESMKSSTHNFVFDKEPSKFFAKSKRNYRK